MHAWRQANTGLNIQNFTRYDFNILNPRVARLNEEECNILRMEFPLMPWIVAALQKVFGEYTFLWRLYCFSIFVVTLFTFWKITELIIQNPIWSALITGLASSFPVFLYQSINLLPDNLALCFSGFYFIYIIKYFVTKRSIYIYVSGIFLMLGSLVKLPFILLGSYALVALIQVWKERKRTAVCLILWGIFLLIPILIWYLYSIPTWGGNTIYAGIFDSQFNVEEYSMFLFQQLSNNIPTMVMGIIPLFLFLSSFFFTQKMDTLRGIIWGNYTALSIFILYFFFILQHIREGHDYYFYPLLPIVLLCISMGIRSMHLKLEKISLSIAMGTIILSLSISWNKTHNLWNPKYSYFNTDFHKYQNELKQLIPNDELCIFANDNSNYISPYLMGKNGYIFDHDHLPIPWLKDMISREIKYMYSDSRVIENQSGFMEQVDTLLAQYGTIKVFRFN